MADFLQNDNNIFTKIKSNYSCISDEQAFRLAKIITQNKEVQETTSKYTGTSFDLYTTDSFVSKVKSTNVSSTKKKQSELDSIIDEDTLPRKLDKTLLEKFADWLSGFEIPDDTPTLTFEDMGVDGKVVTQWSSFSSIMNSTEVE